MSRRRSNRAQRGVWLLVAADVTLGVVTYRTQGVGVVVLAIALALSFATFHATRRRTRRRRA